MEPWGRYGQGVWELIASLLLLTPRLAWAGGILTFGALGAATLFSLAHDGYGISSIGIGPVDQALNFSLVRIGLFAFAVASVSHAFNLIDGQNGLCSGTSILIFVALGTTAAQTDQAPLASLSFFMAAANLGFFAFNFFLLPPYHTLSVADPRDWLVLIAFLITSLVAAQLLYRAQNEAAIASARTREVEKLSALGAETLSAAGNIFLGQTEAPLLIKPFVGKMTQSELVTVMVGGIVSKLAATQPQPAAAPYQARPRPTPPARAPCPAAPYG